MTFTTAFPLIFIAIFFLILFSAVVSYGAIKWLLFGLGIVIWLVGVIWFLDYQQSSLYDYHSPNYITLLNVALFSAFALSYPLTKLRAGKLILRMPRSNPLDIVLLIFALILLCGSIFVLRPISYRVSDGSPIIDAQYFNSQGISFLSMLVVGLYLLSLALQRTEFRKRGFIQNNAFWKWNEFVSHEWHELSDKPAEIELTLKRRPRKLSLK
jgi:hypothetical protein